MEGYDTRVTAVGMQEVLNKGLELAPGLANSTFQEVRVGFRPFTPGFLPVMGAVPGWQGLITANGLGASGLKERFSVPRRWDEARNGVAERRKTT